MAKLQYFQIEQNPHNDMGTALALYFDENPTESEIRRGFSHYLRPQEAEFEYSGELEYEQVSTPVSKIAEWIRILIYDYC